MGSAETQRRRLLILSFSPIATDARVLKQVELFRDRYEVTTCGYGPAPAGVERHVSIPADTPWNKPNGRLVTLRLYHRAYWTIPAVHWVRAALSGSAWDVVLANDVETVPLAQRLAPADRVHADLHEYSTRLHEDNPAWNRWIAPYVRWIVRRYVAKARSWTTVSRGLADEYQREFGIEAEVVTNATPYRSLEPVPSARKIRLVHSGVCLRNRDLLTTVRAVQATQLDCSIDLFLMPNDPAYLEELRAAAAETPDRVRVCDPVPYSQLIETLSGYDMGVFVLPRNTFSHTWALPNKLFDFVQARLGVLIGPSPEMARYVEGYGLGIIADGFDTAQISAVLDGLSPDIITDYKRAANAAARELSSEAQVRVWRDAVDRITDRVVIS